MGAVAGPVATAKTTAWGGFGWRPLLRAEIPVNAHGTQAPEPQPYQGFSSGSSFRPSASLQKPLKRSTTAISSSTASSSSPNFCTAEVWTVSQ